MTPGQRATAIANVAGAPHTPIWRRVREEALLQFAEADRAGDRRVGIEQAQYWRSRGMAPIDALIALGAEVPLLPTWSDAADAAAHKFREMRAADEQRRPRGT